MVSPRLGFANDLRGHAPTAALMGGQDARRRNRQFWTTADRGQPSPLSAAASNCGHILLKYKDQENKRFILLDANTPARDLKTSQLLSPISRNGSIGATADRRSVLAEAGGGPSPREAAWI